MKHRLFAFCIISLFVTAAQAQDAGTSTSPTGVTGFVLNQDYEPIANAKVTLLSRTYDFQQGIDEGIITTKTDEYGHYFFKVDTLREWSWVLVSAEGYPDYTGYYTLYLQEGSQAETIIMVNKARYHQGQYATIVLPTQPEAEWGRFFRLDRVEDDKVIFERELQPQAETPYIIIPDKDFEIAYDANQPSQIVKTSVEGAYFRGYYQPEFFSKKESEYHVTLDGMPDCDYRGSRYSIGEHVVVTNESRIGANRAVLVLDSYQYPWHKLKDSFTWRDDWFLKDGLVLHDATTGESLTWKSAPLTTSHPKSAAYAGFVLNEDNCPVVNATVQLKSDNATLSAATDDYGHFLLPLKDTKGDYELTVIADDLQEQQFQDVWEPYSFTMGSRSDVLTYPEAATFKKGQQATIILPTKPDATWGRFYKLARVDDGKIVFNREMTPQANVPYVIFPEQDFKVSYSGLEFPATAGETAVVGARLVGAYAKTPVKRADHEFKLLIDKTNDCQYIYEDLYSAYDAGCSIGALRCMLVLDSDEYDWASYSLVEHMPEAYPYFIERSFVFSDEAVAVTSPTTNRTQNISTLHDLQGRRITSQPRPGMYIREGKVVVVKNRPQ